MFVIPLSIWSDKSFLLGKRGSSGEDYVALQTVTAFLHLIQNPHRLMSCEGLSWVTRMQLLRSLSLKQKLRTGPRRPLFYKLLFHYTLFTVYSILCTQCKQNWLCKLGKLQHTAVEFPDCRLISAQLTEMSDPKTKFDRYELHLTKTSMEVGDWVLTSPFKKITGVKILPWKKIQLQDQAECPLKISHCQSCWNKKLFSWRPKQNKHSEKQRKLKNLYRKSVR